MGTQLTLDKIYDISLHGVDFKGHHFGKSVEDIVNDYLARTKDPRRAAKSLIRWQTAKCGLTGFATGLGGAITLPLTITVELLDVLQIHLRMVAAIAKLGGYDINSDQVKTLIYGCVIGRSGLEAIRDTGIEIAEAFAKAGISRMSSSTIKEINKKVGFCLVSRYSSKGLVNLSKCVPAAGGVIGAGIDILSTTALAGVAYKLFINNDTSEIFDEPIDITGLKTNSTFCGEAA